MTLRRKPIAPHVAELGRFVVNGVAATAIHYGVLSFNLKVLGIPSAGVANFIAAWFGITASFIGSRFFVFRRKEAPLLRQAARFLALYASIACLHGLMLFVWTDTFHLNYTVGFAIATVLQTALSYLGNKLLVFSAS
ncbi:Putative flippase GtrA (transmembrane translocase of bactoprenol-linked glucose) [Variovorax sp. HW608]|uniref:GtrA family protein n=1 Tax=Variovorax sp. HW608 TaxID=1034889 RepID=UPI00081FF0BB|nr:GtrA family protein [Variovorax sp. HW608]SCK31631.1 Putative flippase GtrA (transmembrane translocase of bactoprenol-linked glucose) [Variovorax sp. HW608]